MAAATKTPEPSKLAAKPALAEAWDIIKRYPLACFGPAIILGVVIQLSHFLHPEKWVHALVAIGLGVFAFTLYLAYIEEVAIEAEAGATEIGVRKIGHLMWRTGPVLAAVAIATTVALVGVSFGTIGLIVGLWLLTRWSLCVPAIAHERVGPREALRQSNRLVKGCFWPVFFTATAAILIEQTATSVFPLLVDPIAEGWAGWIFGASVMSLVLPFAGLTVSAAYNRRAAGVVPRLF